MNNKASNFFRSSSFKFILIGVLSLLLLIPVQMIRGLISEREARNREAANEISESWSLSQTVTGPFLSIPANETRLTNGKEILYDLTYHLLPDELTIEGDVTPIEKKRGIFKTIVYSSTIHLKGSVDINDENLQKEISKGNTKGYLSIGLEDLRGIGNASKISINGKPYEIKPGLYNYQLTDKGVHGLVDLTELSEKGEFNFDITLDLNGSNGLFFVPLGKTTNVTLRSPWADPSFSGDYLPKEKDISEAGFTANWAVNYLNRNYPQNWYNTEHRIDKSTLNLGVNFIVPVDHYQKTERSVKYAFMFIALSFLVFFLTEVILKIKIHPIQYTLVGFGLIIFYTLLISLSEQLGFNLAYLISTLSVTILIGTYMKSSTTSAKVGFISGLLLMTLYGFLFTTLQLQELSLLMGSIGLFIILTVIMIVSRKVNWYKG